MVKNLPAMQETRLQFLDQEDPLEKGMATHFSILAWKIPWTEEPGGLQSMGLQKKSNRTEQLTLSLPFPCLGLFPFTAEGLGSIPGWGTKMPHDLSQLTHLLRFP